MAGALDELLGAAEQERVVAAVREAERRTSGQVKVHLEPRCRGDAFARARALFDSLGLAATRRRNAVLLYVAPGDKKFAILGDQGIHAVAGDALWNRAAAALKAGIAAGSLGDGLCAAIAEVGAALAREFPPEAGGANELPDDISVGGGTGGDPAGGR